MAEDYTSLIPKLLILAQKGEAKAQYHLGVLFNDGKGVPQDFTQAAKWYTQAASQGHTKAQLYLGLLYQKGQGVEQDYRQAAIYYLKAASQGDSKAQYYLGLLFYGGKGVGQNKEEAMKWLKKSAEGGNEEAKSLLDKILKPVAKPEVKPERLENLSELYEPDEDDYNEVLIDEPDEFIHFAKPKPERRKINLVPIVIALGIITGIAGAFMFFSSTSEETQTQNQNQNDNNNARTVVNAPFPDSVSSIDSNSRPSPEAAYTPSPSDIDIDEAPPVNSLTRVHAQNSEFDKLNQEVKAGKIPAYIFERGTFIINPDAKNIRVTGTHVRLRSEPDTKSKILRTTKKGNTLEYYGEWTSPNNDEWILTRYDKNNYGWISGKYTEIVNK